MLKIIQIIAILQGLFLGATLFQRRQTYKKLIFWLFMGCILSVTLFAIGDDDYNLFVSNANWFLFHESLIATFFFLFIRYSNSPNNKFSLKDLIFVLPYLLNIIFQTLLSLNYFANNFILEIGAELPEFFLIGMHVI